MKIVFFGSSRFAVPSLEALFASRHSLSCVVTQPDRRRGRHLFSSPTIIKSIAVAHRIKVFQPAQINSEASVNFLKNLNADLFVVVSYGNLLSEDVLGVPVYSAINIHASLLPCYRGAAPINWVLIRGEKVTGLSVFKLVRAMDAGPIAAQTQIEIKDQDDALSLEDKLANASPALLLATIEAIENRKAAFVAQDERLATYAPKLKKIDGLIEWQKEAMHIHNLVRGCCPWPGAYTYYKGKLLKVYKTTVSPSARIGETCVPGQIASVSKTGIEVACGRGNLIIQRLQIEGKRAMTSEEFIAGHKVNPGEVLIKK